MSEAQHRFLPRPPRFLWRLPRRAAGSSSATPPRKFPKPDDERKSAGQRKGCGATVHCEIAKATARGPWQVRLLVHSFCRSASSCNPATWRWFPPIRYLPTVPASTPLFPKAPDVLDPSPQPVDGAPNLLGVRLVIPCCRARRECFGHPPLAGDISDAPGWWSALREEPRHRSRRPG